jgi:O-antigen/teichoic acid export membrane protein
MVNEMNRFVKDTSITFSANILNFIIGIGYSVILARILGPEGKGIYSLAILVPTLIISFLNMSISTSTVYFIGKGDHALEKLFGNNIVLAGLLGGIGMLSAAGVVVLFQSTFLKEVPLQYLFLATCIIPFSFAFNYLSSILWGLQKFVKYNLIIVLRSLFFLFLVAIALISLKKGVFGALSAEIISFILVVILVTLLLGRTIKPSLTLDKEYMKNLWSYGTKVHIGNILAFLNYRLDMFLINFFLNPLAVGYYSIAVAIAEKLALLSESASIVLFPRVTSETDEEQRKKFTPIVARNTFFITLIGAIIIYFVSNKILLLLFSDLYLKSVMSLQILLPGIVASAACRVLANDIAARGKPLHNSCLALVTVIVNLVLNILWIPVYGIEGAALASMISYSIRLAGRLFLYKHISGNSILETLLIQRSDMRFYFNIISSIKKWVKSKF